jgi:hypothetical protein
MNDPMEKLIADALNDAGISYVTGEGGHNPSGLDFKLSNGIEIEVKRMHSDRIAEQMSRAENVIAVQGKEAVEFFAKLLRDAGRPTSRLPELEQPGCVSETPSRDG